MIRTAIIGVSGFAEAHFNDLMKEVNAGRMKAVAATVRNQTRDAEKCEKLRSLGCELFTDYNEMLDSFKGKLDLCMIPTGIHLHAPMSIAAMRSGANVFVEKPAAALYEEVLAMQAVERETGKFAAVGYQSMYSDEVRAIKRLLIQNKIGRVRSIHGLGLWPRNDAYYARNPWAGRLKVGEYIVLDSPFNNALAHYLNLMLFFAGPDERLSCKPASVTAELFRAHEIESCDTASLRIECEEAISLHFLVTHCSRENFGPRIRIKGEAGAIEWHIAKPTRVEPTAGPAEVVPAEDMSRLREKLMAQLAARLKDPTAFICDLNIAGKQTLCANAAHESSEIATVPADWIERTPEGDSVKTVIKGIDELFFDCFERELTPSEAGAPWASGVKSKPIAICAD